MVKKKKETVQKKQSPKTVKAAVKNAPVKKTAKPKKEAKGHKAEKKIKKTAEKNIKVTKTKKIKETKSNAPQNQPVRSLVQQPQQTGKKRLLISYDKLPDDVVDIIRNKYPYGYNHDLKEVKGIDNKKFSVLPIELQDVIYLVKVDLRKPFKIEEAEEEEDIFTPEEGFTGEDDGFPGEEIEGMEGEEDEEGGSKKKKKKDEDEDMD